MFHLFVSHVFVSFKDIFCFNNPDYGLIWTTSPSSPPPLFPSSRINEDLLRLDNTTNASKGGDILLIINKVRHA
jgi:hypothetical protein